MIVHNSLNTRPKRDFNSRLKSACSSPGDGPCVFTGRTAFYTGSDEMFDDGKGHTLIRDIPLNVCDKTAVALASLKRGDISITDSTWHYAGGGCC